MLPPAWLEIAKGPILRFALVIMLLGLARLVVLAVWGMVSAARRAGGHRRIAYAQILKETATWLLPLHRLHRTRPLYSYASFIFHLGLIFTMLFLQNHVDILRVSLGFGWPALPRLLLDVLTLLAIITGGYLVLYRLYARSARALSGPVDYLLLLLLLNILLSGYVAGQPWNPIPYDRLMLFHTVNGVVLLILIPFTKIAHCVLFPLVRLSSEIAWHLTPRGGADVSQTLYGPEGRKI
jgi:nitrate reductase gamma subunit